MHATTANDLYVYKITDEDMLFSVDTTPFIPTGEKMIRDISCDRKGCIWVSSSYPRSFTISFQHKDFTYLPMSELKEKLGFPFAPEWIVPENNNYWFWQMRLGLCYYDFSEQKLHIYGGKDMISSMEVSRYTDGVYLIKNNSIVQFFQYKNKQIKVTDLCSLSKKQNERIRKLHEDSQGNIWIGTSYEKNCIKMLIIC